ncbi:hypothetical protein KYX44_000601 [Listeria monocytogenes]|nr:hypothetical protein [Listeria monocytogenes]
MKQKVKKIIKRLGLNEKPTQYTWLLTIVVCATFLFELFTTLLVFIFGWLGMSNIKAVLLMIDGEKEPLTKYLDGLYTGYSNGFNLIYISVLIFGGALFLVTSAFEFSWKKIQSFIFLLNVVGVGAFFISPEFNQVHPNRAYRLLMISMVLTILGIIAKKIMKALMVKTVTNNWISTEDYLTDKMLTTQEIKETLFPVDEKWQKFILHDQIDLVEQTYEKEEQPYYYLKNGIRLEKPKVRMRINRSIKLNQVCEMNIEGHTDLVVKPFDEAFLYEDDALTKIAINK